MVIEPGLIRIGLDYGWMRAADMLDVPEERRSFAMELSDKIVTLRALNWRMAHFAAGAPFLDPYRSFTHYALASAIPTGDPEVHPAPTPDAVDAVRANCLAIREALFQRSSINAPTPVTRNNWFTHWEPIGSPLPSNTPWDMFVSVTGNRPAVPAPLPL